MLPFIDVYLNLLEEFQDELADYEEERNGTGLAQPGIPSSH